MPSTTRAASTTTASSGGFRSRCPGAGPGCGRCPPDRAVIAPGSHQDEIGLDPAPTHCRVRSPRPLRARDSAPAACGRPARPSPRRTSPRARPLGGTSPAHRGGPRRRSACDSGWRARRAGLGLGASPAARASAHRHDGPGRPGTGAGCTDRGGGALADWRCCAIGSWVSTHSPTQGVLDHLGPRPSSSSARSSTQSRISGGSLTHSTRLACPGGNCAELRSAVCRFCA